MKPALRRTRRYLQSFPDLVVAHVEVVAQNDDRPGLDAQLSEYPMEVGVGHPVLACLLGWSISHDLPSGLSSSRDGPVEAHPIDPALLIGVPRYRTPAFVGASHGFFHGVRGQVFVTKSHGESPIYRRAAEPVEVGEVGLAKTLGLDFRQHIPQYFVPFNE